MAMPVATVCVFVSSTWLDLQPERQAVEAALQRLQEAKFVGMEYFGSRDESTRCASLAEVDRSQVYVGIFGGRYGSGITEAEYRRARERGLPCFIYFKDETDMPAEGRDADPKQAARLAALKEELRRLHTIPTFTTPDDLAAKVTADLHRWLFDEYLDPQLEKAASGELPREEALALLVAIKDLSALSQNLLVRLQEAGYVRAQGERGIAIGGDVTRSIFVTGDQSIVQIGGDHLRTLSPEERQKKLAEYRQRVVRDNHFVNFRGIPLPRDRSGRPMPLQVPLDKVYIRLQATEEQRSRSQEDIERRDVEAQIRERTDPRNRGSSILEILRTLGEYFYRRGDAYRASERPAPVDPEDALQAHERLVILGAPGAGKSTLLRYLARNAARDPNGPIPIAMRLRDYATALGKDQNLALREFALLEAAGGDEQLRRALEEEVETGHVLWLMDGLDEARGWRDKAAQQADRLPGRLIVTSRPVGYQRVGLESLPHFEILPLRSEDVDQFLRDWFGVLAGQRTVGPDWVEQRVTWLKTQLEQRPRIQPLTRNPLLLTFMVIVAGEEPPGELPSQRAAFYRRYVEDLLDSWETYRRPQSGPEGEQAFRLGPFAGDRARLAAREGFYYLGWYLHLAYYGGHGDETRLNRRDVAAVLARYYKVRSACDLPPGDLQILAGDALEFWLEAGILDVWHIEGEEYLAFRHMTFQEYAATSMLAEAWKKNPEYTWAHTLRPILHHYAWREPILLLGGLLDTRQLNDLVRRLMCGPSSYERSLHRDLRLAAALIGEGTEVDTQRVRQIISHLTWLFATTLLSGRSG
jgi:energy-coupling factor transporter ATP-binding protein EcfA2